ncbi:MAG: helix-turn-helix transcriptional regulator [bacterium]|nr:helix-turn-helix transcriptional regulator [bacterium]
MDKLKHTLSGQVAAKLKHLRKNLDYSGPKMASLLGISANLYHKYETGYTFPSLFCQKRLTEKLGISLDWFIFNKGPMYFKEKNPDAETNAAPGDKEPDYLALMPDVKELLAAMTDDPMLRYEVMLNFHKYLKKTKESKK